MIGEWNKSANFATDLRREASEEVGRVGPYIMSVCCARFLAIRNVAISKYRQGLSNGGCLGYVYMPQSGTMS